MPRQSFDRSPMLAPPIHSETRRAYAALLFGRHGPGGSTESLNKTGNNVQAI
jgi:hypothetical protein